MTPQYFFFDTYIGYFLQVLPAALLAGLLWGIRRFARDRSSPVSRTANTFTAPPPRISVEVAGQGTSPRTWSWMALAGRVQSMGDSARDSRGAKVTCSGSWGVRRAVPAASSATVVTSSSPPIWASRS